LVDFSKKTLIHKTSASDLRHLPASSHTYGIVQTQDAGRLAKGMIEAVRKDGCKGWARFWDELIEKKTGMMDKMGAAPNRTTLPHP